MDPFDNARSQMRRIVRQEERRTGWMIRLYFGGRESAKKYVRIERVRCAGMV